jgi:pimeloyl-ACP methyl ester carboxylesterase
MLHQTPRSLDEFAEVLPRMGSAMRALAMDMVGFGLSPQAPSPHTVEAMAAGGWALLDALGVDRVALMGHHTGAAVAIEMAASQPARVWALVLSSPPWTGPEFRQAHAAGPGVDDAIPVADGSHLGDLWAKRAAFYPPGRPDILNRFIRDALAPGLDPVEGHRACARYEMERRIGLVTCPVLLIGASLDPFAMPDLPRVRQGLINAADIREHVIEGGRIPLMEEFPDEVAQAALDFLSIPIDGAR